MVPYKMTFLQQLLLEYYHLGLGYAQIIYPELRDDSGDLKRIVFSVECSFPTNEVVKQAKHKSLGPKEPPCCRRDTRNFRKGYGMM